MSVMLGQRLHRIPNQAGSRAVLRQDIPCEIDLVNANEAWLSVFGVSPGQCDVLLVVEEVAVNVDLEFITNQN